MRRDGLVMDSGPNRTSRARQELFLSGTEGISRNRSSYNNAKPRHTIAYDLEIPRLLSSVQESKQSSEI